MVPGSRPAETNYPAISALNLTVLLVVNSAIESLLRLQVDTLPLKGIRFLIS